MQNISIEFLTQKPVSQHEVEVVERKGLGHPDSICDAVMEHFSYELCRQYLKAFGCIQHYNLDKALLVAGRAAPRVGGGAILEPMRLVVGDRATASFGGKQINLLQIAATSIGEWFREHLRLVNPDKNVVIQNEIKEGSAELSGIFERSGEPVANDTSAAVGYAPLTETEAIVLSTERYLLSHGVRKAFPELGEDIKVMAYRNGRKLHLTLAIAFIDRHVPSVSAYFERKNDVREMLQAFIAPQLKGLDALEIEVNALDDESRGEDGIYLTVLGTSAESGDSGQVGRGNRANGLSSLNRPETMEAVSGKNPVSHVGKIYSLFSHHLAHTLHSQVPGIQEVYVRLCSRIGSPVSKPVLAAATLVPGQGADLVALRAAVESKLRDELARIQEFQRSLLPPGISDSTLRRVS